jgi:hypothetical protein
MQLVIFLPTFNVSCMRQRFDVTGDRGNILGWDREVNKDINKKNVPFSMLVLHCKL